MSALVYIGVGSNLDPTRHIPLAMAALARRVELLESSTFYWTEPTSRRDQPRFLNGVWSARTELAPRELKFDVLRGVEHELGRRRGADKHAARCIDLDLLLYDERVIDEADIVVPDPEIATRRFLHVPLFELAPDLENRFPRPTPSAPLDPLESDEPFSRRLRGALEARADRP